MPRRDRGLLLRRPPARAKITPEGVFLEQFDEEPAHYLPEITDAHLEDGDVSDVVEVDLSRPMDEIRRLLSTLPIKTRLSLSGPLIVARDIAHARIKEMLDRGEPIPDYFKEHAVYYAGPAKTPDGMASPVRSDNCRANGLYVDQFQKAGVRM